MDFSANINQIYTFEPKSSHFVKQQYSLPCTGTLNLSDEMKHDFLYTSTVADYILN